MRTLAVDVVAQCNHCLLLTGYCVGGKVSIVDFFCKDKDGTEKEKDLEMKNSV